MLEVIGDCPEGEKTTEKSEGLAQGQLSCEVAWLVLSLYKVISQSLVMHSLCHTYLVVAVQNKGKLFQIESI